ncbi:outer membrane receptor for ferrienterochelin and colicins [Neolewinella xylanilytica]|uniref:Outer membrane receptor for ferrienterochelin and colicins n=1 Tax=Neolewinella xylanilytica TaxID=1514080 RepID=A0A2S6I4U3_9BACT|nr:TonB-dependent receptor [Neolewinella xylanilytica]PPK86172.1 outer membrane receptor for ferrienterochelin and colicins [Neolewinella xylanilytica]
MRRKTEGWRRSAGGNDYQKGKRINSLDRLGCILAVILLSYLAGAQSATPMPHDRVVAGRVVGIDGGGVAGVTISVIGTAVGTYSDETGAFTVRVQEAADSLSIHFTRIGFHPHTERVTGSPKPLYVVLEKTAALLDEVVVSGSLRTVSRSQSPVAVEVYSAEFFRANPSPSVFESLQNINGVRPQLNCNVCNTGDIHLNGLEGPYTMVLIDGMPIVSGLSTVYGLTGIPQSLIERVEVVKGPASTLYGSEAVGGLINVITKLPADTDRFSVDVMGTSWGEVNTDMGYRTAIGPSITSMLGINYFNYERPRDDNGDGFTDIALQNRISVFNKWSVSRPDDRIMTFAARYVYEDRLGGEVGFDRQFRGSDNVYGESIYTNRWELFGTYDLPLPAAFRLSYSLNGHSQNSTYGTTIYQAQQFVGFGQLTYHPEWTGAHDLLAGIAYRYTGYDDNTFATGSETGNQPSSVSLPGAFVQHHFTLSPRNQLLLGLRYDRDSRHGNILTPRLNYKWSNHAEDTQLRVSIGNGYRVANVFTEDHAALTGARETVFAGELRPETSWNVNVNLLRKVYDWDPGILTLDATIWYTRFGNRILPDYDTDPNRIIYANLNGHAVSKGSSINADLSMTNGITARIGFTLQDVYTVEQQLRQRQLLTESVSGVWSLNVPVAKGWQVDYTGNVYGPMDLPLLGSLDPRSPKSPWFSIQNLQVRRSFSAWELYGGIKNLLDFTPPANAIARAFDPFDRDVDFQPDGAVVPTPENPYALTFDPTYVYASNQGIRAFVGFRYRIR